MSRGVSARLMVLLLGLSLLRGMLYGAIIPPWQAPDEPWHFEHAKLVYDKDRPAGWRDRSPELQSAIIASMQDYRFWDYVPWAMPPDEIVKWGELHQPPLYYQLSAWTLHFTVDRGMLTQLYVMRLVSVLLGALGVLLAHLSTRILFPEDGFLQVAVPGFVVFLPMHTYMTSVVNNDVLAEVAASLGICGVVLGLRYGFSLRGWRSTGVTLLWLALLGLSLPLGFLSKRTFFFLIPVAFLAVPLALALHFPRTWLGRLAVLLGIGVLATVGILLWRSGWLLQRWTHVYSRLAYTSAYPELGALLALLPAMYTQYAEYLFKSFWAFFGYLTVELNLVWYALLAAACLTALVGLMSIGVRVAKGAARVAAWQGGTLALFFLSFLVIVALTVITFLNYESGAIAWAGKGQMPQGRYLFPAIIPIGTLLTLGWRGLIPVRYRFQGLVALLGVLFLLDLICLCGYIIPYFYGAPF